MKNLKAAITGHEKYTYNVKKKHANIPTETVDECPTVLAKVAV